MKKSSLFCLSILLMLCFTIGVWAAEDKKKILGQIDFQEITDGTLLSSDFAAEWSLSHPAGDAPAIVEEEGNRFLRLNGYSQILSPYVMSEGDASELTAKLRLTTGTERVGFFVRASAPVLRENPYHSEYSETNRVKMHIQFYESDWYQDAMKKGTSYMGGSGIGVFPEKDNIKIIIKTYIPDVLKIGVAYHAFDYPEGMDPNTFLQYSVKDNGRDKVEFYIGETLLATVSFSDSNTYEDPEDSAEYYQSAVMTDGAGNVVELYDSEDRKLEKLDCARIACDLFYTAFACRASTMDLDDIVISVPETEATATPQETPFSSDTAGQIGTAAANRTPGATNVPQEEDDSSLPLVIGLTAGGIVVVGGAVCYLVVLKKKNKK